MKNNIVSSPSQVKHKRPSYPSAVKGAKVIRCSYCRNTFYAVPRDAICPKCKFPANKPLSWANRLLCLMLFPFGLVRAIMLSSSRPYASSQALLFSILGALICAAIYYSFYAKLIQI